MVYSDYQKLIIRMFGNLLSIITIVNLPYSRSPPDPDCLLVGSLWLTGGQSYKFTSVNYDPRVVIWGIFKSGTPLES